MKGEISFLRDTRPVYKLNLNESEIGFKEIIRGADRGVSFFLSIKFSTTALSTRSGFKQYDYESLWNFQIEIRPRAELVRLKYERMMAGISDDTSALERKMYEEMARTKGYYIRRHKIYGEIPNLKWYRRHFTEYSSYKEEID